MQSQALPAPVGPPAQMPQAVMPQTVMQAPMVQQAVPQPMVQQQAMPQPMVQQQFVPQHQPMAVYPAPTQVLTQTPLMAQQPVQPEVQYVPQYLAAPQHFPALNPQGQQLVTPTMYERVYVEAPVPRFPGGRELQYLPPMEMNVTRGPTGYLDVDPRGGRAKEWYNTWLYVPEKVPGDPQFDKRFEAARIADDAAGDGHTYLDRVGVERRYQFYKERFEQQERKMQEDADARRGIGINFDPTWHDAYTGGELIEAMGRLENKTAFMKKHGVQKSDWESFQDYIFDGYSYDNLRVPWPFETGEHERNKMVSRSAIAFDRRSPLYTKDASYELAEGGRAYYHSLP